MDCETFRDRMLRNFERYADRNALSDDGHPEGMTYRELDEKSGRVSAWLRQQGIGREQIMLVNLPRGIEHFVVGVGALRAGVGYTLTEEGYPQERLDFIAKDCGSVRTIDRDAYAQMMATEPESGWVEADEHDAAFVVYTSGTTGMPKGALHEVGQLSTFMHTIHYHGEPLCMPDDKLMLLSPLSFSASTLAMLACLCWGCELAIASYATAKNPVKLHEYMRSRKITASFMTPSLVQALSGSRELPDHKHPFNPEFRKLILSSEQARNIWYSDLVTYNVYGQTETCFLGGVFRIDRPYEVTPIGQCMKEGVQLTLRDVSNGMGEVCVPNPYCRGYLNLPEMTEYAFRDGIYHTGDIGRMTETGDVVLLGRNDDMVKINGNRVEPAEIEAAVKRVLGVSWCAARAFVRPERAYVCAYYTEDLSVDAAEAIRHLSELLPAYMVPSCLMKIDKVPLNANGKMDRRALPEPKLNLQEHYEAPANEMEKRICDAFAQVLGISRVGATDDFYRIGGDSMKTIKLMGVLNIAGVSTTNVFRERTARNLVAYVMSLGDGVAKDASAREQEARQRRFPLTDIQRNFYDIQMGDPESLMWIIPLLFFFENADEAKLLEAARRLSEHHPIFCTVLEEDQGTIYQRYAPQARQSVEVEQGSEEDILAIRTESKDPDLPFQMLGKPLAKLRLIRTEKGLYLFVVLHHVIIDGLGVQALLRSLRAAIAGQELVPDNYYSWLERQKTTFDESRMQSKRTLDDLYAKHDWTCQIPPISQQRSEQNGLLGAFLPVSEEWLTEVETRTGLSRTGLFACVMILSLARFTGKHDILINWIYSNRGDAAEDAIACMLIKSLALGVQIERYKTLKGLFDEVHEQMLTNIACSDYEWCLRNPPAEGDDRLFFVYEGAISSYDLLGDLGGALLPMMSTNQAVVHDMSSQVLNWTLDGVEGMLLACYYDSAKYREEDMKRFERVMQQTAAMLLMTPGCEDLPVVNILEAALPES